MSDPRLDNPRRYFSHMGTSAPLSFPGPGHFYDPANWYWHVGNHDTTVVFSGAAGDYVPLDDPAYLEWLSQGHTAPEIPTDGELAQVLANAAMPAMAIRNAGWTDWGNVPVLGQLAVATASGVHIVFSMVPALSGVYAITDDMRLRINTNVDYINRHRAFSPNEASTKDWPDVTGAIHTFTDTDHFLSFATAIADYYAQMNDWALGGGGGAPPQEPIVIAVK